jgi:ABC-2 type transport system permease protein
MKSYFNSAIAYVIIIVFLALVGWFYVNNIFLINAASMRPMFDTVIPLIFLLIIPAITMRLLSEESKTGTIEFLATKPVREMDIVLGKFFAAWSLISLMLAPTLLFFITIASLGEVDYGVIASGYFGLLLVSAAYISFGIFASSITNNQIVAFIIGLVITVFFYFIDKALMYLPSWAASTVQYFGVDFHYLSIARGVIDTRDLLYFATLICFMLYLTVFSLGRRKWQND